jgi:hypothetical protein
MEEPEEFRANKKSSIGGKAKGRYCRHDGHCGHYLKLFNIEMAAICRLPVKDSLNRK